MNILKKGFLLFFILILSSCGSPDSEGPAFPLDEQAFTQAINDAGISLEVTRYRSPDTASGTAADFDSQTAGKYSSFEFQGENGISGRMTTAGFEGEKYLHLSLRLPAEQFSSDEEFIVTGLPQLFQYAAAFYGQAGTMGKAEKAFNAHIAASDKRLEESIEWTEGTNINGHRCTGSVYKYTHDPQYYSAEFEIMSGLAYNYRTIDLYSVFKPQTATVAEVLAASPPTPDEEAKIFIVQGQLKILDKKEIEGTFSTVKGHSAVLSDESGSLEVFLAQGHLSLKEWRQERRHFLINSLKRGYVIGDSIPITVSLPVFSPAPEPLGKDLEEDQEIEYTYDSISQLKDYSDQKLLRYALKADGAYAESCSYELYLRFLASPTPLLEEISKLQREEQKQVLNLLCYYPCNYDFQSEFEPVLDSLSINDTLTLLRDIYEQWPHIGNVE